MDNNSPSLCSDRQCCVNTSYALGSLCAGDHRGEWTNETGNAGSEHPRTKGYVAARIAQAAYATAYNASSPLLPLLSPPPLPPPLDSGWSSVSQYLELI